MFIEKCYLRQCCGTVTIIAVPLPSSDIGKILVPVRFRVCLCFRFRLRMQIRNRLRTKFKTGFKKFPQNVAFSMLKAALFHRQSSHLNFLP
jgi:hypothetical protein